MNRTSSPPLNAPGMLLSRRQTAVGDYINFGQDAKLADTGTSALFTTAMWFYQDAPAAAGFLTRDGAATNGWTVRDVGGGTRDVTVSQRTTGTDPNYITSGAPLNYAERWVCLAVRFDGAAGVGAKFQVYYGYEGVPMVAASMVLSNEGTGTGETDAAKDLCLGNRLSTLAAALIGRLGPFAYWNQQQLTLPQLLDWQLNPMRGVGLPTILAFPDGASRRMVDYSGNALHGTLTSGLLWAPPGPMEVVRTVKKKYWSMADSPPYFDTSMKNPAYNTLLRM